MHKCAVVFVAASVQLTMDLDSGSLLNAEHSIFVRHPFSLIKDEISLECLHPLIDPDAVSNQFPLHSSKLSAI